MTCYVCVENKRVISILTYNPNVPKTVKVYEISIEEYNAINTFKSYFDVETKTVKEK
jgi:hypothetical protein